MGFEERETRHIKIGVLAVIGSFIEHVNVTSRAANELRVHCADLWGNTDVEVVTIRTPEQVNENLDALIVPGGETTVISRFIEANYFVDVLKSWTKKQNKVGGIDITCERNGFGRQRESHVVDIDVYNPRLQNPFPGSENCKNLNEKPFSGVFLRAPLIKDIAKDHVEVLCSRSELADLPSRENGTKAQPVGVMQGNMMATTFHPELTDDLRWHAFFLQQAMSRKYLP